MDDYDDWVVDYVKYVDVVGFFWESFEEVIFGLFGSVWYIDGFRWSDLICGYYVLFCRFFFGFCCC